jgi:hemoglobin-like flavoprotein
VFPENTAPTERDLMLVRESFDRVVPIAGVAADMFYERLFYMAPSLRRLFPADMRDQKRKLMVMLASAVQGLANLDMLVPVLTQLGARHAIYGVTDEHYKVAGEALIWTLERGLGNAFTPDVERAWVRVYRLMAATMQAGADEVAAMQAGADEVAAMQAAE